MPFDAPTRTTQNTFPPRRESRSFAEGSMSLRGENIAPPRRHSAPQPSTMQDVTMGRTMNIKPNCKAYIAKPTLTPPISKLKFTKHHISLLLFRKDAHNPKHFIYFYRWKD